MSELLPEGSKVCQCGACGLVFTAVTAFDVHRVGAWENRRCLTPRELEAAGYRPDGRGRWGSAESRPVPQPGHARKPARQPAQARHRA